MLIPSQQVALKLKDLTRSSNDLICMHDGELNIPVSDEIISATVAALNSGETRYSDLQGILPLRNAISRNVAEKYGFQLSPSQILVSNGSSQSLFLLLGRLIKLGDEIIVPNPSWPAYVSTIANYGGRAIAYSCLNGCVDFDRLVGLISNKTKAIVINSPHNPTGMVFDKQTVLRFIEIVERFNILLISDEAYEDIVFGSHRHYSPQEIVSSHERLAVTRTFSKIHSMTGYRVGYLCASETIINQCAEIQAINSDNVCTFAQHGAFAALTLMPSRIPERVSEIELRATTCFNLLREEFDILEPQGGFYLFVNIAQFLCKALPSDSAFVDSLLLRKSLTVTPGSSYGQPNYIRLSVASVDIPELSLACERLLTFVREQIV